LKSYLDQHGRVFLDLDKWSTYLTSKERVLGTRLHGAIIALNSGTPAILLAHDSRTSEMIDFAGIPTISPAFFAGNFSPARMKRAFSEVDIERYESVRSSNFRIYQQFLEANGLSLRP
jgi:polysaccharide pyruvyl transferase WcaK-like protein